MKTAAALIPALFVAACARHAANPAKPSTPVTVTTVERITPSAGQRYSASILPERQVTLSFRVGGFVEAIQQVPGIGGRLRTIDIGDVVPAGAVLARIRRKDYDLQVNQAGGQLAEARRSEEAARAQVAQAEAAAAKASQDFERASFLFKNGSLTKPDYDAAKAQHDAARAQVEAARAQLEATGARIRTAEAAVGSASLATADTVLTAPFTAAVVDRRIEIGALAAPGAPAIVLADISSVKAAFGVPDMVAVTLKPGLSRSVSIEALPGRQFQGTITGIAAVADQNTRLFQVNLTLPNRNGVLRPGMIASLSLAPATKAQAVPVVPLSAIIRSQPDGSGFAVMLVQDGRARRRAVTLGDSYGSNIAVISGVQPGDRVINRGASLLAEGEPVEVMP